MIAGPIPLTAGSHVLRVTNDGKHAHEMKILRVLPGHTYDEVKAWKPGQPVPRIERAAIAWENMPGSFGQFAGQRLRKGSD